MEVQEMAWSDLTHFNPKQLEAERSVDKYKYTLYGGAMGGGKSYFLRWIAVKLLAMYYNQIQRPGIRVGLFCEDYPSLKDRHISKINFEFPSWLGDMRKGDNEFHLKPQYGGGVIAFRNLDDASKYASSEFAAILVDELTKNTKEKFNFLRTRMRWPGISNTKFVAGTNPGSIGHVWVKDIWMDGKFENNEKEADQFNYVKATAYDNNANLDETYFNQLEGLPEKLRQAFLMGNWDLFEGQFFSEFNRDVHVIEPFKIPDSWRRFGGYDHGRAKPACFKWYAIDNDGNIWVYRELYVNREDGSPRWEADQIAQEAFRITTEAGEHLEYVVADSAIFAKTGFGETIAEIFQKNGVGKAVGEVSWENNGQFYKYNAGSIPLLIPSHKDRVAGWTIMHQHLYHSEEQEPKMRYFSTCPDSIRTIPGLVHSSTRPEDLDTDGEDHAADVDRYFLQTVREKKATPMKTYEQKRSIDFKKKLGIKKLDVAGLDRFQV